MALSSKQPSQSHWYSRHPTTRLQHQLGGLPPPPAAGLSSSCNRAREDRSHSRRHRCGAALVTRCFLATSAANRAVMPCCNRTVSGRRENHRVGYVLNARCTESILQFIVESRRKSGLGCGGVESQWPQKRRRHSEGSGRRMPLSGATRPVWRLPMHVPWPNRARGKFLY